MEGIKKRGDQERVDASPTVLPHAAATLPRT
jgi:hypothetical protein